MSGSVRIRRALVSVSDKTDIVAFVKGLLDAGVEEIVSTGGTARMLDEAGVAVTPVESLTGFPEMMDGRVKTLHPKVHGGLLAKRDDASHVASMEEHGIAPIDLVCINLYPFEQTIAGGDVTPDQAIEQIDIGGPAMIRSAAKNHASVAVVTDAGQYDDIVAELREREGSLSTGTLRTLAGAAFMRTSQYDTAIAAWMGGITAHPDDHFPSLLQSTVVRERTLRYGENPHQMAAVYADPSAPAPNVVTADVLGGKPLSYNNVADASAAVRLVRDLARSNPGTTSAAVIKHTNPCGASVADDVSTAIVRAHAGDPLAAYGGILAVSAGIDRAAAERIVEVGSFFEVVAAPSIDEDARDVLSSRWANLRLLQVPGIDRDAPPTLEVRSVLGGLLVQHRDDGISDPATWTHAAGPAPDDAMIAEARIAWMLVKHATSNGIAITRDGSLIGVGTGQVDRVSACRLATAKAGDRLAGDGGPIVAASDAFFPFPDGPEVLADAGVHCLIHPGGSKRDGETHELCESRGITCLHTGRRHFRH